MMFTSLLFDLAELTYSLQASGSAVTAVAARLQAHGFVSFLQEPAEPAASPHTMAHLSAATVPRRADGWLRAPTGIPFWKALSFALAFRTLQMELVEHHLK